MDNSTDVKSERQPTIPKLIKRSTKAKNKRIKCIEAFVRTYFTYSTDVDHDLVGTPRGSLGDAYQAIVTLVEERYPPTTSNESMLYMQDSTNRAGLGKGASSGVSSYAATQSWDPGFHETIFHRLVLLPIVPPDKRLELARLICGNDDCAITLPAKLEMLVPEVTMVAFTASKGSKFRAACFIASNNAPVRTPTSRMIKRERLFKDEPVDDPLGRDVPCNNHHIPVLDNPDSVALLREVHQKVMSWSHMPRVPASSTSGKVLDLQCIQWSNAYFSCVICNKLDFLTDVSYDPENSEDMPDSIKCKRCKFNVHVKCAFPHTWTKAQVDKELPWTCPACSTETDKCWCCQHALVTKKKKKSGSWPCTFCHHWMCSDCCRSVDAEAPLLNEIVNPEQDTNGLRVRFAVCQSCYDMLPRVGDIKIPIEDCSI